MHAIIVTLRLLHVVGGAIWVGIVLNNTVFLGPAIQDVGPDGGKVMAALQKRGLLTFLPILALVTVLSGVALYGIASAGFSANYLRSRVGLTFGVGGLLAIVGYGVGLLVMRPNMLRALQAGQSLAGITDAADRAAAQAQAARFRARGAAAGRVVLVLILAATAAMAVGRFV